MGCSETKEGAKELVDTRLKTKIGKLEIDSIDADMKNCEDILKAIENVRCSYSSSRIELFVSTGSTSYKTPDPKKSIQAFLWQLATETNVN